MAYILHHCKARYVRLFRAVYVAMPVIIYNFVGQVICVVFNMLSSGRVWANRVTDCRQKYFSRMQTPIHNLTSIGLLYGMMTSLNEKKIPRYWPFVWGINRSPVNSPHKGHWRGTLMFSLICALNKRLSKQSLGLWFETPWRSLWRHCSSSNFIPNRILKIKDRMHE